MAARDASFTELTTKNVNFKMQIRHQEDRIQELKAEICNLKVAAAKKTTEIRVISKGRVKPYTHKEKNRAQWPTDPKKNKHNNKNYFWYHGYDTSGSHILGTCKLTSFCHKKEPIRCEPLGGQKLTRYMCGKTMK